jgi:hypothetical protein
VSAKIRRVSACDTEKTWRLQPVLLSNDFSWNLVFSLTIGVRGWHKLPKIVGMAGLSLAVVSSRSFHLLERGRRARTFAINPNFEIFYAINP